MIPNYHADRPFSLLYGRKKQIASEKEQRSEKSKIWLQSMPQPVRWRDLGKKVGKYSIDDTCW